MSHPLFIEHTHEPIYRVVRCGTTDPLDASHSRRRLADGRWNNPDFTALYCCCSEWVARAVALEKFRLAGVDLSDLPPDMRPQLVELSWSGTVVDLTSPEALAAAGFAPQYPDGVRKEHTRRAALEWSSAGAMGIVFRSASLLRRGFSNWVGPHQRWSELVIFPDNCQNNPPRSTRRREDLKWLSGP